jgi:hypothetical protein
MPTTEMPPTCGRRERSRVEMAAQFAARDVS